MEEYLYSYTVKVINLKGQELDISELVATMSWKTELYGQAGVLTLDYIDQAGLDISSGSAIDVWVRNDRLESYHIFKGIIAKRSREPIINNLNLEGWEGSNNAWDRNLGKVTIECYDLLWQLRFPCSLVVNSKTPMTSLQAFKKVCSFVQKLHYTITPEAQKCQYYLIPKMWDNRSINDCLMDIMKETLNKTSGECFLYWYDDLGTITLDMLPKINGNTGKGDKEFKDVLVLSDGSGVINFNFNSEITESANWIYIYNEHGKHGKKAGKRQFVEYPSRANAKSAQVQQDLKTMSLIGTLPHVEKVNDNLTQQQLEILAKQMHNVYCRPKITLTFSCIGEMTSNGKLLRAGNIVLLDIEELRIKEKIYNEQLYLIDSISHNFEYGKHTMELGLRSETLVSDRFKLGNEGV